ncbi:hypothetical protein H8356DRAFT_1280404 [Neocallimastix lanati (nom. inval.)]|nr:hypothetical protein H8356DRAFT_1280404 [Neocallimastix sp. JGI-2020a]
MIRLFATKYMRQLLQEGVQDISKWGMKYLVIQLYDIDLEVCKTAVRTLEEACNYTENLESVVALRPSLQHLGNVGNSLLLKFLTTSVGYNYLYELGYIEKCLTHWYEKNNVLYTIQLELAIEKAFSYNGTSQISHLNINGYYNDPRDRNILPIEKLEIPPHFYGELIKSKEGSDFPREKGSSKSGITFLLEEDIIKNIIEIAEKSKVLTLKGTSFYIIGMISKTSTGAEKLEEYGWKSPYLPFGNLNGICVPNHSSQFLNILPWKYKRMFDNLKIENRYAFKNDDELSIKSESIIENENKDNNQLDNISEEKNMKDGEISKSNYLTNNTSNNMEQINEEKNELNTEEIEMKDNNNNNNKNKNNNNEEDQNEKSNEDNNDNEGSELPEKIEIIKNDELKEELNNDK